MWLVEVGIKFSGNRPGSRVGSAKAIDKCKMRLVGLIDSGDRHGYVGLG